MNLNGKNVMKRSIYLFLTMFLLVCQTVFAADFSKLVILHTNDSHGYDMSNSEYIGMPVIAQIKQDLEAKGFNVLMLDAGDIIQGNDLAEFDQGKSIIKFFNMVGYDAATLGNHEFDYGQDVLKARMKEASFPFVSSNIIDTNTGRLLVPPTAIINKPYGKIGIIGLTTPSTKTSSRPHYVENLKFLEGFSLMVNTQKYVNKLKAANCDLIIALGHMGSDDYCMGSRSEDIAANVSGIDICIDGHDHKVKNDYIGDVLRVETGCYTEHLGCIVYKDGKWQEEPIPLGKYTNRDAAIDKAIQTTTDAINEKMSAVFGEAVIPLDGARLPGVRNMEMPIGDFCSDALLWQANELLGPDEKVHCSIVNGGAIRTGIDQGQITLRNVISVFPFKNELAVMTIKGSTLLEILEASTQNTPGEMGSFPQVAGINYSLDTRVPYAKGDRYAGSMFYAPAAPGSRVTIQSVGGQPFDAEAEYRVVVNTFILEGGDSYGGLQKAGAVLRTTPLGITDTQALQNYVSDKLQGKITSEYANSQKRIDIIGNGAAEQHKQAA